MPPEYLPCCNRTRHHAQLTITVTTPGRRGRSFLPLTVSTRHHLSPLMLPPQRRPMPTPNSSTARPDNSSLQAVTQIQCNTMYSVGSRIISRLDGHSTSPIHNYPSVHHHHRHIQITAGGGTTHQKAHLFHKGDKASRDRRKAFQWRKVSNTPGQAIAAAGPAMGRSVRMALLVPIASRIESAAGCAPAHHYSVVR